MNIALLYFTSTGNTLWLANRIRDNFLAKGHKIDMLDSVTAVADDLHGYDMIGIVYPVWGSTLPNPLRDIISQMDDGNGQRVFLIGNPALFTGDTGVHFTRVLSKKGYDVVYADHTLMPTNLMVPGFSPVDMPSDDDISALLDIAASDMDTMCEDILAGSRTYRGKDIVSVVGGTTQRVFYDAFVRAYAKKLVIDQDRCTQCGLCHSICPTGAIVHNADGTYAHNPSKCILCVKCYNYCPATAILIGKKSMDTKKYKRYTGINENFPPIHYRK